MYRVLIIDDEPLARRGVAALLGDQVDMQVVGECGDGYEAASRIRECGPDLIFLDIQMPGMSGFDVLRQIPRENLPLTIFLTAYDEFAVRAFDIHALDYLLKPIDEERFVDALRHARHALTFHNEGQFERRLRALLTPREHNDEPQRFADRFSIRTGSRLVIVSAQEIEWIEAMGDYAGLHTPQKTHLLRESLNELALRLDPKQFVRVHRSILLNLAHVRTIERTSPGRYLFTLNDGQHYVSGRNYSRQMRELLSNPVGRPQQEPRGKYFSGTSRQ